LYSEVRCERVIKIGAQGQQNHQQGCLQRVGHYYGWLKRHPGVARRHEISSDTIHTWLSKYRKYGTVKPLPRAKDDRQKAMQRQLREISTENDRLKRLLADKELELAILRELRDISNTR
jgi:transposase